MKLVRILLFPLVPVYCLVTWIRNKFFDFGLYQSKRFDHPIICVGNLSTGGTGKTPMVEYLIRQLQQRYNLAVLSRGYKRNTKGFLLADTNSTYNSIGDEPFQYHSKFKNVQVAVDEKRVRGITNLLQMEGAADIIILDDAFQHRQVKAGLNILLTAFDNPFYKDVCLPTGNLREPISGRKRADIIIVTKCPNKLTKPDKAAIREQISPLKHQTIFFSSIQYAQEARDGKNNSKTLQDLAPFTLVTGIAKPAPVITYLKQLDLKFEVMTYPDHHSFSVQDIKDLQTKERILTTEKDYTRLCTTDLIHTSEVYYLPIEFSLDKPKVFEALITDFLRPAP